MREPKWKRSLGKGLFYFGTERCRQRRPSRSPFYWVSHSSFNAFQPRIALRHYSKKKAQTFSPINWFPVSCIRESMEIVARHSSTYLSLLQWIAGNVWGSCLGILPKVVTYDLAHQMWCACKTKCSQFAGAVVRNIDGPQYTFIAVSALNDPGSALPAVDAIFPRWKGNSAIFCVVLCLFLCIYFSLTRPLRVCNILMRAYIEL